MDIPTDDSRLIYDWNHHEDFKFRAPGRIELDDESLRDGCQSPSVTDPPIEAKLKLLHLMERMEIDTLDMHPSMRLRIEHYLQHRDSPYRG